MANKLAIAVSFERHSTRQRLFRRSSDVLDVGHRWALGQLVHLFIVVLNFDVLTNESRDFVRLKKAKISTRSQVCKLNIRI